MTEKEFAKEKLKGKLQSENLELKQQVEQLESCVKCLISFIDSLTLS